MRRQRNDPLLDSKLAVEAFVNQLGRLAEAPQELLTAWHWLTTTAENGNGFDLVFSTIKGGRQAHSGRGQGGHQAKTGGRGLPDPDRVSR